MRYIVTFISITTDINYTYVSLFKECLLPISNVAHAQRYSPPLRSFCSFVFTFVLRNY